MEEVAGKLSKSAARAAVDYIHNPANKWRPCVENCAEIIFRRVEHPLRNSLDALLKTLRDEVLPVLEDLEGGICNARYGPGCDAGCRDAARKLANKLREIVEQSG